MLVSVLLLPLFFALTGMRTRFDLLNGSSMWIWAGIVLAAAIFGKMGGAIAAARWTGQSWRDAIALGALLNTRGLVELIVLNIAYNVGAFTPTLFTMMVVIGAGDDDADGSRIESVGDSGRQERSDSRRSGRGLDLQGSLHCTSVATALYTPGGLDDRFRMRRYQGREHRRERKRYGQNR